MKPRIIKCHSCNKVIERPPSQTRGVKNFCNHSCYSKEKEKQWSKSNNPRWQGGSIKFICKVCKKPSQSKRYGKRLQVYCSKECSVKEIGINYQGSKHWNWKGGDTRYLRKIAPRPKPDRCEVCGALGKDFKKGLCLDHNHSTNKFRGWLCTNCNTTLGLVKENPDRLLALIKYINENSL